MTRFGLVLLLVLSIAACASTTPPAAAPSKKATAAVARRSPRPALPPAVLPPAPAPRTLAAVSERERCEVSAPVAAHGFYPSDVWPAGELVLTFDDGPHPGKTPKVLDLLAKHDLTATFFVVGVAINKKTYRLVQRMVAEGHTIGSHSYNHDVGMGVRNHGERSIEYIRGQHETTQILIELALLAQSEQDFENLYRRVFEKPSGTYLPSGSLRKDYAKWVERHHEILAERGASGERRPYPVVFSRPPGGGPYLGLSTAPVRALYDSALARAGMLNVMWHGESGDTHPEKKHDFGFLTGNLSHFSKKGGILLIHDYIRGDALALALARIAEDPSISVVPLERAVQRKYGCTADSMLEHLKGAASPRTAQGSGVAAPLEH